MGVSANREELRSQYHVPVSTEKVFIPAREKADIYGTKGIFRTCAYCRVSTDNDEQLSSFELQQEHYKSLVGSHPNWDLQHIYADEGISGTSLKKRDQFNEMIAACENGEYDLIVTKSVSRFARNLVDCITLARRLKNLSPPVGIFFETDNLFTLSEDSELKLSLLATFAQEESVKKSESMNWSLKERFKNGKLLTPELFGYERPRDATGRFIKYAKLQVVESEAEIVRFIYDAFLAGYSTTSIAEILTSAGCKTKIGNSTWNEGAITYILKNERYCGNVLTWKTFTADMFEHKHKRNCADRDQYLYVKNHEAIVSQEKFEAVQKLIENRKHGLRGQYPIMHVIDSGIFRGYIPVNHHWINDSPTIYYEASNSVSSRGAARQLRKSTFSAFNLTGYQVVRSYFLTARSEQPCISISDKKIAFNVSCMKKFKDVRYVQLLLHPTERKIAIRPCMKDDIYSIPWRKDMSKHMVGKMLSSPYFCSALFAIMEWHPDYNYKVMGAFLKKGRDEIIVFDLASALPQTYVYGDSEEERRKKKVAICPEDWGDNFGDEFYDYSISNIRFYASQVQNWQATAEGKPFQEYGAISIPSFQDVQDSLEKIKIKVANENEQ